MVSRRKILPGKTLDFILPPLPTLLASKTQRESSVGVDAIIFAYLVRVSVIDMQDADVSTLHAMVEWEGNSPLC